MTKFVILILAGFVLGCSSVEKDKLRADHERMKAELLLQIAEQDTVIAEHAKLLDAHKEVPGVTPVSETQLMQERHRLIIEKYIMMDQMHKQILKKHEIIENRHQIMDPSDKELIQDHIRMENEYRRMEADHEQMEKDFHTMDQEHLRAMEKKGK